MRQAGTEADLGKRENNMEEGILLIGNTTDINMLHLNKTHGSLFRSENDIFINTKVTCEINKGGGIGHFSFL
jgi:hypothetical protein